VRTDYHWIAGPIRTSRSMSRRAQTGRVLTSGALHGLLARLDADPDRAGEKYEAMRRRLIAFFDWRGAPWPEEHADETINRVATRAAEDDAILQVEAYAVGVARMVLFEALREKTKARPWSGSLAALPSGDGPADEEARWTCLDGCLGGLPPPERELILEYYAGNHADATRYIEARRAMADRLGVAPRILRARAFRVRTRLETCVRACVDSGGPPSPAANERSS
jgi:DNA-directed RNA polymerase specialized sigma24 family protein